MSFSRGLAAARLLTVLHRSPQLKNSILLPARQQVRNSHEGGWLYRKTGEANSTSKLYATTLSAIMWWWIIWHCITEYEEFLDPMPDPSKFTDEELGIPPI